MHSTLPIAVITILKKDNKILLLKRKNTPWMNWFWWLPGGRLDAWESMTFGAIRELDEEIWIKISPKNILEKTIIQHKDERWERIYFTILVENFDGIPKNNEPEKCEEIAWFDINNLPENTTPQVKICLKSILEKKYFSEFWY